MSQQRQHILLGFFKTLSVGLAAIWTCDLLNLNVWPPAQQTGTWANWAVVDLSTMATFFCPQGSDRLICFLVSSSQNPYKQTYRLRELNTVIVPENVVIIIWWWAYPTTSWLITNVFKFFTSAQNFPILTTLLFTTPHTHI